MNTPNNPIPVLMEDAIVHTAQNGYRCQGDPTCPCSEELRQAVGYAPNGSNDHDHLCSCPGCDPQPPDPTEDEVRMMNRCQSCGMMVDPKALKVHTCPSRR